MPGLDLRLIFALAGMDSRFCKPLIGTSPPFLTLTSEPMTLKNGDLSVCGPTMGSICASFGSTVQKLSSSQDFYGHR